jgi:23S rRNA pseudouridine1911/1915/1917 synthase
MTNNLNIKRPCARQETRDITYIKNAHFEEVINSKGDQRLIKDYLSHIFPFFEALQNEEYWQNLFDQGYIQLNNQPVSENRLLAINDTLSYHFPEYYEDTVDTHWTLLWQNKDMIAVNKPAGLPVSRTTRNTINTLVRLVQSNSPFIDAHLLHRLDLETSGIILLAKDKEKARFWQPKIAQLLHRKIYHAVVHGEPTWTELEVMTALNTKIDSAIRCKMHTITEQNGGKPSHTKFRKLAQNDGYALIECELFTGRKHQIRAHLASINHAIVGDKIYSHDGEYFLKRLDDTLTADDDTQLGCKHHLLFSQCTELNLSTINEVNIRIKNKEYPSAWLSFCKRHGLLLNN